MARPAPACRRALHQVFQSAADYVWVSDEALGIAICRFSHGYCHSQRRHGSYVPGPLEARRRHARRRIMNMATTEGSDGARPPPFLGQSSISEPGAFKWQPPSIQGGQESENNGKLPSEHGVAKVADGNGPLLPSWLNDFLFPPESETTSIQSPESVRQFPIGEADLESLQTALGSTENLEDIRKLNAQFNPGSEQRSTCSAMYFHRLLDCAAPPNDIVGFLLDKSLNIPKAWNFTFLLRHLDRARLSTEDLAKAIGITIQLELILKEELEWIVRNLHEEVQISNVTTRNDFLLRQFQAIWNSIKSNEHQLWQALLAAIIRLPFCESVRILAEDITQRFSKQDSEQSYREIGGLVAFYLNHISRTNDLSEQSPKFERSDFLSSLLNRLSPSTASAVVDFALKQLVSESRKAGRKNWLPRGIIYPLLSTVCTSEVFRTESSQKTLDRLESLLFAGKHTVRVVPYVNQLDDAKASSLFLRHRVPRLMKRHSGSAAIDGVQKRYSELCTASPSTLPYLNIFVAFRDIRFLGYEHILASLLRLLRETGRVEIIYGLVRSMMILELYVPPSTLESQIRFISNQNLNVAYQLFLLNPAVSFENCPEFAWALVKNQEWDLHKILELVMYPRVKNGLRPSSNSQSPTHSGASVNLLLRMSHELAKASHSDSTLLRCLVHCHHILQEELPTSAFVSRALCYTSLIGPSLGGRNCLDSSRRTQWILRAVQRLEGRKVTVQLGQMIKWWRRRR